MTEQRSSKKRLLELRIAAGTRDGKLGSGIWRIWQGKNNDDIYIAPRSAAGAVKASFHRNLSNRYSYFGFTKQYAQHLAQAGLEVPPGRAWTSWERPETPDNQCLWAAQIWFPPGPLYDLGEFTIKDIRLIEPPPHGKAIVISVGFSRIPEGAAIIPPDVRELGYSRLSTGEYVVVFAQHIDFDYRTFKDQHLAQFQEIAARGQFRANEERILGTKNPRMFLVNDPKADGVLKIFDAPVIISRGQLGSFVARI